MKRIITILLIIAGVGAVGFFTFAQMGGESTDDSVQAVVDVVLAGREQVLLEEGSPDFGTASEINVLLLGLDARKGNTEPHCDAIHMFTLNVEDWTISITSVPRGTYAYIPPGTYDVGEYYLANACSYAGLEYGIGEIEKILGVKADYVASVGFSQVIGLARLFELPTTETLEWLRHRQSYAIGEPQRSHNQAVFIKDMIINRLGSLESTVSLPFQYLAYRLIDTDMDFGTARALISGYVESDIQDRPDDISLAMKPYYQTVDYHLDLENADEQIQKLMEYIGPFLSSDDFSGRTLEDVQDELEVFVRARLDSHESINELYQQKIWLQIEDDETREEFHYDFVRRYVEEVKEESRDAAIDAVSAYILEKTTLGLDDAVQHGRELMAGLVSE
ncbi:MAG: hypothetical protein Q8P30_00495 [Candidatus Uhrbacteria bacterium]|nr:hypothetical protein [Candidatus Uhrbacteria bacterium]